ncbi:MAG: transglycosylase SLT domain-containing protein [Dehalococcoidia bacterium]
MIHRSHAIARLLFGGLAIAALVLAACGGDGDTETPTPTPRPSPAVSPVPSDTPIDLPLAERLYYEGDFEGALGIYSAAVENGTEAEKQVGLWETARIQAGRGQNADAERNLEALRATSPGAEADRQALLLLGNVEFAQGDTGEAREAFESYVEATGPAQPYALLYLAQIESADGHSDAAIADIEEALLAGLPAGAETEALLTLAAHYEADDDIVAAAETYDRIAAATDSGGDAAEALWRLGNLRVESGDVAGAQSAYRRLINSYPGYTRAAEALATEAAAADPQISAFSTANVYFLQRLNGEATSAFHAILDNPTTGVVDAARAHYHLGILAERASLYDDAISHYDSAIGLLTPGLNDTLRGQAMWDRATVLELLGDINGAIAGYASVGDVSASDRAGEATFRAGFLAYSASRPGDAATYWTRFAQVAPNAEERARAHFWLAQTWETMGDAAQANVEYAVAVDADPLDFYGMRAAAILGGETAAPSSARLEPEPPDWVAAEAWLTSFAGPEDAIARTELFAGEQWQRGIELHEAGLDARANDEFNDVLDSVNTDPWLLYRVTRELAELGLPWLSTLGGQRLAGQAAAPPPAVLRLWYPLEYFEIADKEARANGFDPLLTLSMIRQESLYDPDAVSIAEAMGLTQVIPATADDIAAALDEEDFTYSDLFRPNVSIRFGAYYLGTQLEGFGGVEAMALAAYNGGPGNAGDWADAAGGDPDLFVEAITFPETRAYVELVLENYARYQYAYGLTEAPSLPQ